MWTPRASRGHIGSWTQLAVDTSDVDTAVSRGHSGPWIHRVVDAAGHEHIGLWTQLYASWRITPAFLDTTFFEQACSFNRDEP